MVDALWVGVSMALEGGHREAGSAVMVDIAVWVDHWGWLEMIALHMQVGRDVPA